MWWRDSPEAVERDCRRLCESAREDAEMRLALSDADGRERAAQFLADYDRVSALSGSEFVGAAMTAIDRYEDQTEEAREADLDEQARQLLELLERALGTYEELLRQLDARIGEKGEARVPPPIEKRFREHATRVLADADRLRALPRDDFILETLGVFEAHRSINWKELKAEIHTEALMDDLPRLPRRMRQILFNRLSTKLAERYG